MPSKSLQALLLLLVIFIGLVRFIYEFNKPSLTGEVVIKASLENEPKISGKAQVFKVDRFTIVTNRFPELHYGDRIKIKGEINQNKIISYPEIVVLAPKEDINRFSKIILSLRQKAFLVFSQNLPEPQASVLAGIVLGIDRIPASFLVSLRNSGLVHLVVVSGQNITLLAGFVMLLSGIIKRQTAILLTFLVIGFYTILAGAEPPVIRAALMGSFAYIGQFLGKQTIGLLMLFWSFLVMFLIEPYIIFNLSFILSFSATLGILVFGPYLKLIIKKPKFISEAVCVSTAAWIITLPILIISFGQVSVVSIASNILVSFVVLPIMILGFVMLIFGFVFSLLAQLIGYLLYLPLTYLVVVSNFFANLPFATIKIENGVVIVSVIYYLILIVIFAWLRQKYSKKVYS